MNSQAYLRPIPASHTMQPQTPVSPEAPTFQFNPISPRFPSSPVYIPSLSTGWVVTDAGDSKTSDPSDLKEPTVYFPASVYAEALFFFSEASKKTGEAAAFFLTEKIMPMHPQFMAYDFFIPGQSASPGDVDIYGSETLRYAEHFVNTYPERFGKDVHRHLSHAHSHPGGSPSSWSGTDFTQQTEKTQMAKQSQYRIYLLWNEKSCMQASMWIYDPWAVKIAGKMRLGLYFGEGMGVISEERKAFITQEIETKLHKKHVMGTFTGKGVYSHMREDFDYAYGVGGASWHWDGRKHTPSSSAKPAKTAETKFAETIIPRSAVYPHPLTTQAGSSHVSAAEDFTRKLHAVLQDPTPAASAELPIEVGPADGTNDEYAKMIRSKAEQVVITFFEEAWLNAEADPDYSGLDVAALTYKVFDLLKDTLTDNPERPAYTTAKGFISLMHDEALPIEYETALNAFLLQVEMAIEGSYEVDEPDFPGSEDADGVVDDDYYQDFIGFGNQELSEYFSAVNFDDQQEVAKAVIELWEELHERFTSVA